MKRFFEKLGDGTLFPWIGEKLLPILPALIVCVLLVAAYIVLLRVAKRKDRAAIAALTVKFAAPVYFLALALFWILLASKNPQRAVALRPTLTYTKFFYAMIYFTLLAPLGYFLRAWRGSFPIAAGAGAVAAILLELLQLAFGRGVLSLVEILAMVLGVLAGAGFAVLSAKKKSPPKKEEADAA